MTGERFVEAIRSHGCETNNVRDAAHEAAHAKQVRLRAPWTRDRIHAGVERRADEMNRPPMIALVNMELEARAVEKMACAKFGEPYEVEEWALTCWMETSSAYRVDIGSIDGIVDAIRSRERSLFTQMLFRSVIAIRGRRTRPELLLRRAPETR